MISNEWQLMVDEIIEVETYGILVLIQEDNLTMKAIMGLGCCDKSWLYSS